MVWLEHRSGSLESASRRYNFLSATNKRLVGVFGRSARNHLIIGVDHWNRRTYMISLVLVCTTCSGSQSPSWWHLLSIHCGFLGHNIFRSIEWPLHAVINSLHSLEQSSCRYRRTRNSLLICSWSFWTLRSGNLGRCSLIISWFLPWFHQVVYPIVLEVVLVRVKSFRLRNNFNFFIVVGRLAVCCNHCPLKICVFKVGTRVVFHCHFLSFLDFSLLYRTLIVCHWG